MLFDLFHTGIDEKGRYKNGILLRELTDGPASAVFKAVGPLAGVMVGQHYDGFEVVTDSFNLAEVIQHANHLIDLEYERTLIKLVGNPTQVKRDVWDLEVEWSEGLVMPKPYPENVAVLLEKFYRWCLDATRKLADAGKAEEMMGAKVILNNMTHLAVAALATGVRRRVEEQVELALAAHDDESDPSGTQRYLGVIQALQAANEPENKATQLAALAQAKTEFVEMFKPLVNEIAAAQIPSVGA